MEDLEIDYPVHSVITIIMAATSSNLNRFSKLFYYWKEN